MQPFIRDVFDQFSETRTGGAFTFMTGIGGFLQEFLYGYSGLRWDTAAVGLQPSLTSQLGGVVLHDVSWHGRRFTVAIGPTTTSVSLERGGSLPVRTAGGLRRVAPGHPLVLPTERPDLAGTPDAVRCQPASASTSQPGTPALAAVDGSAATGWQPVSTPAVLRVPVAHGPRIVTTASLEWGRRWPEPAVPDQPPAAGPVTTLGASTYAVSVSTDGHRWREVAVEAHPSGSTDVVHFGPTRARYVAVRVTAAPDGEAPLLDELTVS